MSDTSNMSGFSDLAMSLHLRNNPKSIRKFTTRTLSERRHGKRSNSTKQVSVLLDVWKHLPAEERMAYSRFAILHEQNADRSQMDETPEPATHYPRGHDAGHSTVNCENARPPLCPSNSRSKSTRRTRTIAQEATIASSSYISDEPNRCLKKCYAGEMNEVKYTHALLPQDGYKLFIGDVRSANDMSQLQKHKITAILTLGKDNSPTNFPFVRYGYQTIPLEDKEAANLLGRLNAISQFLDLKLQKGNVLVHCYFGVSRSCAAVIGYLMKRYQLPLSDARRIVTAARPCIDLSPWFDRQLKQYENVFVCG